MKRKTDARELTRDEKNRIRRRKRILKTVFWIAVLGVAAWFFLFGNDVI